MLSKDIYRRGYRRGKLFYAFKMYIGGGIGEGDEFMLSKDIYRRGYRRGK